MLDMAFVLPIVLQQAAGSEAGGAECAAEQGL
jgi:hypothetical protein